MCSPDAGDNWEPIVRDLPGGAFGRGADAAMKHEEKSNEAAKNSGSASASSAKAPSSDSAESAASGSTARKTTIRVALPHHLRTLAKLGNEISLEIAGLAHAACGAGRSRAALPNALRHHPRPCDAGTPPVPSFLRLRAGSCRTIRPTPRCRRKSSPAKSRSSSSAPSPAASSPCADISFRAFACPLREFGLCLCSPPRNVGTGPFLRNLFGVPQVSPSHRGSLALAFVCVARPVA